LSDEQWALIADLIPAPDPHPNFPKAIYPRREIVDAILCLLRTLCPWRHLPHDFPRWQLVASYYYKWKAANVLAPVLDRLLAAERAAEARKPTPALGIIDSRSVQEHRGRSRPGLRGGAIR